MYRSNGDILYIGKAKSLKRRVNSYFQKRSRHSEHILEMLSQAKQITTEPTETALEAALKESDEIKKLSPPYNIALQKRERRIVFFSKDLESCDDTAGPRHPIGPFSTTLFMESWVKMMAVLNANKIQEINSSMITDILGTPPEYAPDEECFSLGARLLKDQFIDRAKNHFSLNSFLKLGSLFWKERMDELAAAEMALVEDAGEEEETTLELEIEEAAVDLPSWSPEKVARAFKSIIRTGAHQARRARWFCRLSESTLVWDKKDGKGQTKNIILLEQGKIHSRDTVKSVAEDVIPKRFDTSTLERQKNLDLAAFDRMRILTTEVKRLLSENRAVEVLLGPGITLRAEQLKRILEWV
jgi:DNA polymerase-3 subunit epsilon